ncbi:MAG: cyclase family protein [Hyphomicrobiaceae bacterium]
MRIIDLSMPILADHPRWKTEVTATGNLAAGDLAQVTTLKVSCHAYTHVDARRHMFLDGATIEATRLDDLVGPCAVIDLMDAQPNEAIGPERLAPRAMHLKRGGMALFKSGWDRHRSPMTKEFWLDSPYLTREAAQWLLDSGIKTIAYDFPQDYCIRLSLKGEKRPLAEHVTHDILLRAGVHMIEYVANTADIRDAEVLLSAAPLKIPGGDGAPARVYCIEGWRS